MHEIEVIERQIQNSDENRFIELIKPGIILAVFTDNSRVDYFILKCISEVKQFKQATLEDLENNSQAKIQGIEGVYIEKLCAKKNTILFKLIKVKNVSFTCRVSDIFVLGLN